MKIVPLSLEESVRAMGATHLINLKVANGDLDTAETLDGPAIPAGYILGRAFLDIKTAWGGGTSETISVGIAATASSGTTLFSAQALTAAGTFASSNLATKNDTAARFITITRGGTGTSNAGEANLYFEMIDATRGRNTFP